MLTPLATLLLGMGNDFMQVDNQNLYIVVMCR